MGQPLGVAKVDVGANTDPFEREVIAGVREGTEAAEADLKDIGDDMGETVAKSMGDRLEKEGPALARSVENGLRTQKVRTKVTVQLDKEGNEVRRWVSSVVDEIQEDLADAFTKSSGRGGFFGTIGTAISDAIGASFNISGRSPLIIFLVPLIGGIIAIVLAALQALNALIPVLLSVPALLAAIGLQVGVVAIAFKGLGTAIGGAFAAKNAKELNAALKDLTPSAQEFVRSLLPLRPTFEALQKLVQENFFKELGGIIAPINYMLKLLTPQLGALAGALGNLFHTIATNPRLFGFLSTLTSETVLWVERFTKAFDTFFTGLLALSVALMPFIRDFGSVFNMVLSEIGAWFLKIASDPEFQEWLSDMIVTLVSVWDLLKAAGGAIKEFLQALNEAGGDRLIVQLTDFFEVLGAWFDSPEGQKSMDALVGSMSLMLYVLEFLVLGFFAFLAAVQIFGEYLAWLVGKIGDFFGAIGEWFGKAWEKVKEFFRNLRDDFVNTAKGIGPGILNAVKDFGSLLIDAGRNLISGLIFGVKSMTGKLGSAVGGAVLEATKYFPHSPAEKGPLSGQGDPFYSGQKIIERLSAGITAETNVLGNAASNAVSNVVFGPGSVSVGFNGALPTKQEANQTGMAAGMGVASLLGRNTRLAVRTT